MTREPTEMERKVMVALWHRRNKHRERYGYGPPGDAEKQELWEDASAAIRAMREPTHDMVQCGHGAGWHWGIEGDKPCEEEAAGILWKKMIDAASPEGK